MKVLPFDIDISMDENAIHVHMTGPRFTENKDVDRQLASKLYRYNKMIGAAMLIVFEENVEVFGEKKGLVTYVDKNCLIIAAPTNRLNITGEARGQKRKIDEL